MISQGFYYAYNNENPIDTKLYARESFSYPCTDVKTCYPYTVILFPGKYQFECWGASGMKDVTSEGGMGAYAQGNIFFTEITKVYLYLGSTGGKSDSQIYNGGGSGQQGGGGATDIRLKSGNWNDFDSLKSRIMVAAGGGGSDSRIIGGNGGALIGEPGYDNNGKQLGTEGNQTNPGCGTVCGGFGFGGGQPNSSPSGNGGGGGGYYGGGCSKTNTDYSGGGGSSYISGHFGCNSISEQSIETNIQHTNSPNHYSNKIFSNTVMITGNQTMPGIVSSSEIGHMGNGIIRITLMGIYHVESFCIISLGNLSSTVFIISLWLQIIQPIL